MEITEVRIKLMDDPQERLQAFCSITFDHCFVVRDLKIIEGTKGSFVAMPSRKLTDRCPGCYAKNYLRSGFCSQCGVRLQPERALKDDDGRAKLYADIAHPINSRCREMIQQRVLVAFEEEVIRAQQPGYICTYDDYGEENYAELSEPHVLPLQDHREAPPQTAAPQPNVHPQHSQATTLQPEIARPHFLDRVASREREEFATRGPRLHHGEEHFGTGIL